MECVEVECVEVECEGWSVWMRMCGGGVCG